MKKSLNYDKFFEWWSDGRSFLSESHAIAIYNSLPPDQSRAEVERLRGLMGEAVDIIETVLASHYQLNTMLGDEVITGIQAILAKLKAVKVIDTKREIKRG